MAKLVLVIEAEKVGSGKSKKWEDVEKKTLFQVVKLGHFNNSSYIRSELLPCMDERSPWGTVLNWTN